MNNGQPKGPWNQLGKLLLAEKNYLDYQEHPSRNTLVSYVEGDLLAKPTLETKRLSQLTQGGLTEWSEREVATHVSTCRYCEGRISLIKEQKKDKSREGLFVRLKHYLFGPARTRINPALAGATVAQFGIIVVLAAIILTSGLPQKTQTRLVTPTVDLISELERTPLYVQFSQDTTVGDLESLIQKLDLPYGSIQGPIENSTYIIFAIPQEADSLKDTLSQIELVKKVSEKKS